MKKKVILAVAVLAVILIAVYGVAVFKQVDDMAVTEIKHAENTAVPGTVSEPAADADEEEVFEVAELYGTVTEVTDGAILLDVPQLGMVQAMITDDTMLEGVEEIKAGQVVKVIYDGKMTRSIPAQITAMLIGVYAVEGEVKAVQEGSMTVLRADTQDEVIISLPEGTTVSIGERVTAYTTGAMTMSLPPQMNAVAVVK